MDALLSSNSDLTDLVLRLRLVMLKTPPTHQTHDHIPLGNPTLRLSFPPFSSAERRAGMVEANSVRATVITSTSRSPAWQAWVNHRTRKHPCLRPTAMPGPSAIHPWPRKCYRCYIGIQRGQASPDEHSPKSLICALVQGYGLRQSRLMFPGQK